MSKSELVSTRIIRHVRYVAKNGYDFESRGGVTFLFNLDYLNRLVNVSFAVCSSNDNFCKADGIRYAEELGVERTMNLDEFQKYANQQQHTGFVSAYLSILRANKCLNLNSHREENLLSKIDKRYTV